MPTKAKVRKISKADSNNTTDTKEHIKAQDNKYKVYNYLKRQPGLLITIISSIVAIFAFVAQVIAVAITKKELAFWCIDPIYVNLESKFYFTNVIIMILLGVFTVFYLYVIRYILNDYINTRIKLMETIYFRNKYKSSKKAFERLSKKLREENRDIEESIDSMTPAVESVTELLRSVFWGLVLRLILVFTLGYISALVLFTLYEGTKNNLLNTLVFMIVITIETIILHFMSPQMKGYRKLKKNNNLDRKTRNDESEKEKEKALLEQGKSFWLSDNNIAAIGVSLLIVCIMLCCTSVIGEANPIKDKNEFQIVELGKTEYTIVHKQNEQLFLEEVNIKKYTNEKGDICKLTIYTNKQRIITTDDVEITTLKVDNVKLKQKQE